jgi:2-polyprenyl-3-methyl-5-hydroxy-6-metoxy-1,4-benzoquinol methylase
MIFENPRYDARTILKGYMASQEEEHDSQYPMRVYSFYRALKKQARRLPPPGAKVIDIGTAGGAFIDAAKKYGYNAYGMEPSADLVARGKKRGLQIEQGTIESHTFAQGTFDMVCLWDVIEHLPDPKSALVEIRKLLKPNGILLINFPDIGTWQAKLAGKHFWWILSVHLHHFTRNTIRDICSRTGFEAFHFQRYWQTLEFGYLERMAVHYRIPFTAFITSVTPCFIQRISIPYYASQTTTLARIKK